MDNKIKLTNVNFYYNNFTGSPLRVLKNINFTINNKIFLGIAGETGSGKSTLLQHLNSLLKPTVGKVEIGNNVSDNRTSSNSVIEFAKTVGLVFQFPEHQLMGGTVLDDVQTGPINYGFSKMQAKKIALEKIKLVGLPVNLIYRSPFELSGGEMRKVAIAGVLALNPKILVLDEPTAGLDPEGKKEIMNLLDILYKKSDISIILVTHQMEDIAKYANDMIVMGHGEIVLHDKPRNIFSKTSVLEKFHLEPPLAVKFAKELEKKGIVFDKLPLTEDELAIGLTKNKNN